MPQSPEYQPRTPPSVETEHRDSEGQDTDAGKTDPTRLAPEEKPSEAGKTDPTRLAPEEESSEAGKTDPTRLDEDDAGSSVASRTWAP